ncbi:hypothetical protein [Devosia insulae]|nr:hypothetical protein [Devosia insulae]
MTTLEPDDRNHTSTMTTYALVSVACPHCGGQFLENAKLVRPDGGAWCPHCEKLFTLDPGNQATRRTLAEAKAARRRRKERLNGLRATWMVPPPPKPLLMGDVLRALDELLLRLDGLTERKRS